MELIMSRHAKFAEKNFKIIDQDPKVIEWFGSINGEGGVGIGVTALYIRVSRCNASCSFCDTNWHHNPKIPSIYDPELAEEMRDTIVKHRIEAVTLTGGEILMYLPHIAAIYKHIRSISPWDILAYDLESNGIMLHSEQNTIALLKEFNTISRNFARTKNLLTISPKIDAKTSWSHMGLTQDEVTKMYLEVAKNCVTILDNAHKVVFKFVYDFTNKVVDFGSIQQIIDKLVRLNTPRRNILLMPLTPDDPHGKDKQFWEESKDATARKAFEMGLRYSPRIHIDRRMK